MGITNKNDVLILRTLIKNSNTTGLTSTTLSNLQELLDNKFSNLKIRKTIYDFLKEGHVREGLKQAQSKTYFVTNLGKEVLKKLIEGVVV